MPRTPKDSAPAVQVSGETSTVGKSERSVNPSVPPESFPSSVSAHHWNIAKRIAITIFLTLSTLIFLLVIIGGFLGYSRTSWEISSDIDTAAPSVGVAYPNAGMERAGVKFQAPESLGVGRGDAMDVYSIILPPPPLPEEENAATPEIPIERKIVRNGNLTLLVTDVTLAADRIQSVSTFFGGFIESKSFNDNPVYSYGYDENTRIAQDHRGTMTVRIPSERFDEALGSIKAVAVRVDHESSSGQDVSAQYVDLEARLKNLRATEERYLALIGDAKNVEEVLKVESYLSATRENIERIQGQLNLLSRQVSMSTILVTLVAEPSSAAEKDDWRPRIVAKGALQSLTAGLIDFANSTIAFLIILPLLLIRIALWIIVFFLAWRVGKWLYLKVRGASLPPPGGAVS